MSVPLPDEPQPDQPQENYILSEETIPAGEYAPVYRRVFRDIVVLAVLALCAAFYLGGLEAAGGLLLGALVAAINFWWMQRSIIALTDIYAQELAHSGANTAGKLPISVVPQGIRFFLRYLLIGSVAFVMMKGHREAAMAFFGGLALPVAALIFEGFVLAASGTSKKTGP